jgi:hypothetical protein
MNVKRKITHAQMDGIGIWLGLGAVIVVTGGLIWLAVWLLTRG